MKKSSLVFLQALERKIIKKIVTKQTIITKIVNITLKGET